MLVVKESLSVKLRRAVSLGVVWLPEGYNEGYIGRPVSISILRKVYNHVDRLQPSDHSLIPLTLDRLSYELLYWPLISYIQISTLVSNRPYLQTNNN